MGFSGKNTGVRCQALLQAVFPTQESDPGLPHCRGILYCLSHQGSPSSDVILTFVNYLPCHLTVCKLGKARRRQWHPAPVLLPGKSHGRRNLVGCSPWGREELDTTERLPFHFSLSCIGEGNGNPLQCSCLENPTDGGTWWASVYGVTQSRTRLKRLSSSRSPFSKHFTAICWKLVSNFTNYNVWECEWGTLESDTALFKKIFYWSVVALQCCISFYCTAK